MTQGKTLGELNGPWVAAHKMLTFLIPAVTTIGIALSGAALSYAFRNTERLTALETRAMTGKDGLEIWQEIGAIRSDLARIPRDLIGGDKLEARLIRIEAAQNQTSEAVARIAERLKIDNR